ncbi:hypothetical protein FC15_GL000457 [Lapidilactobacillus concavus DSM 17758]|uniref:Uncharacterized protein n=1 Tax=Lapidilactobacillus concavus DSM 17758 TaxID=1423735 RepID=A0A0R1WBW8_9LACO|nr:hypothetical protein [Lapidilactobacillus concavus]KRM12470.1 hypothetical protein FC15_GL000457 [Lapidilactobacillus concavus DSM 17758]GEL13305.1 hypothetical protein LCO01nite_08540 [Lapidilactobacillus concavus]
MKRRAAFLVISACLQLMLTLTFHANPESLNLINYGLSFRALPIIILSSVLVTCFDVNAILIPVSDIFQISEMIKTRTSTFKYFVIGYRHTLPLLLSYLMFEMISLFSLHVSVDLFGLAGLVGLNFIGVLMALKLGKQRYLFMILFGLMIAGKLALTVA